MWNKAHETQESKAIGFNYKGVAVSAIEVMKELNKFKSTYDSICCAMKARESPLKVITKAEVRKMFMDCSFDHQTAMNKILNLHLFVHKWVRCLK